MLRTISIVLLVHSQIDPSLNMLEEDEAPPMPPPAAAAAAAGPAAPPPSQLLVGYSGNPWGPSRPLLPPPPPNETGGPGRGVSGGGGGGGGGEGVAGRSKRGVLHLYNMVLCATGCNPLSYKGYGCYCGFLGSGRFVDPIDRCCKMHDWCYHTASCPMYLEYFIPYVWKCYRRRPLCAIEHGIWGGGGSCAQRLCECDRQLAECLRRYPCPRTKAVCTSSPWRLLQNLFML